MAKTRQLLLLRHAKSSWDDAALADFDRPLAPRGLEAAPRMGAEIARRGWLPELVYVSPAMRTRQTWQLASAQWPAPLPATAFHDSIYGALANDLFALTRAAPDETGSLLVIGHNPGLEIFAAQLAGPASSSDAVQSLEEKFPSGALARFEFEGDWDELRPGMARLTHCLRPRELA
ncbi:histidine phosphatase family protein [Aminobacter anthyllidis]|uniref:SixA phosphatase family protein n=1 Tax=Aminobacter anthyllidis TaxID=1035067 RepID=UPI0024564F11|nr:histidine phosphatase family protein [Aminobacter anthyllidis]MDH4985581.1 histidine phosphatase family protein [Aminobacter anthyllidis]